MPGVKYGSHVGCPTIGLFMTSVRGGGACVCARERKSVQRMEKKV